MASPAASSDSCPEYEAMVEFKEVLITALSKSKCVTDLSTFTKKLESNNLKLITTSVANNVCTQEYTAEQIVSKVTTKIKDDSTVFGMFVQLLIEENSQLQTTANELKEYYSNKCLRGEKHNEIVPDSCTNSAIANSEFQQPSLGRPFKLGMYYDYRKDNLLLGINMCKNNVPETSEPQLSFNCEIISSDTLNNKAIQLGLPPDLHLSLLAGLVQDISGSAKYWNDRRSSMRVARVCLKYESTTCIKQLAIDQIGREAQSNVFEEATHVVIKIVYGVKAFFIFDREIGKGEDHDFVHKNMIKLVTKLSHIDDPDESSLSDVLMVSSEEVAKYNCRLYCDFTELSKISCTLSEALNVLITLKRKESQKSVLIPQKVCLYPMSKLDEQCRALVRPSIRFEFVEQLQSMLEILYCCEIQAYDALSKHNDILSRFNYLQERLTKFAELIATYRSETTKQVAQMLPLVREGKVDEAVFSMIFEGTNESPFSSKHLTSWLEQVDEEITRLQILYQHLTDMKFASRDLQSIIDAFDCDYIVCFTFNLGTIEDQTIKQMKSYLQNDIQETSLSEPWYTNTELMQAVLHRIEHFKLFANANKGLKSVQFLVTNKAANECSEIGSILLYEGATFKVWVPPSAPGKPVADVTQDSVKLQWTKPQYGSDSVQKYNITCHSLDNLQEIQNPKILSTNCAQESFCISGLKPETSYTFTVQPVCCCGVGTGSEVSNPIVTERCCQPGKPTSTSIEYDYVQLKWTKPEHKSGNVCRYTVLYHTVDNPENKWDKKTTDGVKESITVTGLSPETKYVFKILPEFKNNVAYGTESEISDEIMTKALTCQPGKPTKCNVTHNSIELNWSKPPLDSDKVECYMIYYRPVNSPLKFKSKPTEDEVETITITGLALNTSYVFKVRPVLEDGVGLYSELSEPIKTTATSAPANLKASTVTGTSVTLQWNKPEYSNEAVTSYTIFYHSDEETADKVLKVGNSETAFVSGLLPSTKYVFRVQPITSNNNVGSISKLSDPVETKPTSAPGKPTASAVTCDSVELKWTMPKFGHNKITHYLIVFRSTKYPQADHEMKWITDNSQNNLVITDLDMNTGYQFKVCPECGECGDGTESEFSNVIYTKATSPPSKPTATTYVTNDSINAEIEWTKPEHGSENIESYSVLYQLETKLNGPWIREETNGTKLKATLTELVPNLSYLVKIVPECKNGLKGSESETSNLVNTKATSKPGKPSCSDATHYSITLEWTNPKHGVENVDSYVVFYHSVDKSGDWKEFKTENANNFCELKDLAPCTKYEFKVQPVCIKSGEGAVSDISEMFQTKPVCRPGKPESKLVTHNSIKFTCEEPEHYHDNVDYYCVYYHKVNQPVSDLDFFLKDIILQECELRHLEINTEYVIKVLPVMKPDCDGKVVFMESEECHIKTKVTSQPGKPTSSVVTCNSFEILWDKPTQCDEDIQSYTVFYHKFSDHDGSWDKVNTKGDLEESIKVTNLIPQTKYIVKVQPNCRSGTGCMSEASDPIETDATCKPGTPRAVKITHNRLELQWDKPQHHSENVQNYKVSYYNNNQPNKMLKVDGTIKRNHRYVSVDVSSLLPNTTYIFKVSPVCRKSAKKHIYVEDSTSDLIKTKVTSSPQELQSSALNHSTIKLSWKKPLINGDKIKYFTILSETNAEITKTNGPQESVILCDLTMNTPYIFKVRPECGDYGPGTESKSSDIIFTKATSAPSQPIATGYVTHNIIEIEWKKPEHGSENIKGYSILLYCNSTGKQHDEQIQNVSSQTFHSKIEHLSPHTEYFVKILPECLNGSSGTESKSSECIVTKATSPPYELKGLKVTHSSITLNWTKPDVGSDRVNGYTVYYHQWPVHNHYKRWRNLHCDAQTQLTVDGLSINTQYVFRVLPECETGVGTESSCSDPIETKATSPSTKLKVSDVTHNSVKLSWTKPDVGSRNIKGYRVFHHSLITSKWTEAAAYHDTHEYILISQLKPKQFYQFKVIPLCRSGEGSESEASEYIQTKPVCKPGTITATRITHDSIAIKWSEPEDLNENVECYSVSCHRDGSNNSERSKRTNGSERSITITGLKPKTKYIVKVSPNCKPGTISEMQDCMICTTDILLAERNRRKCEIIRDEEYPIEVYKIPVKYNMDLLEMAKCHVMFDNPNPTMHVPERVIMLVGATGAGKSTLINSIVNHIYGVDWEHEFRFKLVCHESTKSQAHSQTPKITAYTFYPDPESQHRYALTIVDTPGFGDTRGIHRDKEITRHIKEFFSVKPPNGIDQIHAIGFVVPAASTRLTETQKYVFDSILTMFGKDIENNICLMATFADRQEPKVLEAIKEANIQYFQSFKFNNAALYAKPSTLPNLSEKPNWDMNCESLISLFNKLDKISPQSLQLTRDVLDKREELQAHIDGLQEKLFVGLGIMIQLQQEQEFIMKNEKNVLSRTSSSFEVRVPVRRRIDVPEGQCATNCTVCRQTCHFPCSLSSEKKLYKCAAMKGFYLFRNERSTCKICPQKCSWRQHEYVQHRLEIDQETKTCTLGDLIARYIPKPQDDDVAIAKELKSKVASELKQVTVEVFNLIHKVRECVQELERIALKAAPLDNKAYIDLIIENEKRDRKEGFQDRIATLEELKDKTNILEETLETGKFERTVNFEKGSIIWNFWYN